MKKWAVLLSVMAVAFALAACAGTAKITLTEPEADNVLIIGNILFEFNDYNQRREVYRDKIQVGIVGSYMQDGEEMDFSAWVDTDDNGYFFYPNAPNGKFELKGIRFYPKYGSYLGIIRDLNKVAELYHRVQSPDNIIMSGFSFLYERKPVNRIINMRYIHFQVLPNGEILHEWRDIFTDYELVTKEILTTPFIFEYFLERDDFKETGWVPFLQAELAKWKR